MPSVAPRTHHMIPAQILELNRLEFPSFSIRLRNGTNCLCNTSVVHQSARTHGVRFVLHHHREVTLIHAALELQPPTEPSAVFRSWATCRVGWRDAVLSSTLHLEQVTLLKSVPSIFTLVLPPVPVFPRIVLFCSLSRKIKKKKIFFLMGYVKMNIPDHILLVS